MYKNNIFHKKKHQKTPKNSQKTRIFFKQPPTCSQRSVGGCFYYLCMFYVVVFLF